MDVFKLSVADHPVPLEYDVFIPDFRNGDPGHLLVGGKRPELQKGELFPVRVVSELHVRRHAHPFFKEGAEFFHKAEKAGVPPRKVREGKDGFPMAHLVRSCPVEEVFCVNFDESRGEPVFPEQEGKVVGQGAGHEPPGSPVDIVKLALAGHGDVCGQISLGPEHGVGKIGDVGLQPVDRSRSQAETEPDDTVLFPYAGGGPAVDFRKGGSGNFGVIHGIVLPADDRLDHHCHGFVRIGEAVFLPVGPGRRIVKGCPDILHGVDKIG